MRKFSKVTLCIAAVMGTAGIGLSAGGAVMGANLSEVDLQRYYDGHYFENFTRWIHRSTDWEADTYGSLEELRSGTGEPERDAKTYTAELPEELDFDLEYDELILTDHDGEEIRIDVYGDEEGNVAVDSNEKRLKIQSREKTEDRRIVVFCPRDTEFRKVAVAVEAGTVLVENELTAEDLEVSVGAGVFSNTSSVTAGKANARVGTGTLALKELDAGEIDAECGLGTMELEVEGEEEDYSYRLACGAGSMELDGGDYSGVGAVKEIKNPDAERKMNLKCGMGTLKVSFI